MKNVYVEEFCKSHIQIKLKFYNSLFELKQQILYKILRVNNFISERNSRVTLCKKA